MVTPAPSQPCGCASPRRDEDDGGEVSEILGPQDGDECLAAACGADDHGVIRSGEIEDVFSASDWGRNGHRVGSVSGCAVVMLPTAS